MKMMFAFSYTGDLLIDNSLHFIIHTDHLQQLSLNTAVRTCGNAKRNCEMHNKQGKVAMC